MSWALQARILIRLDARQGQWCSLEWLAGRLLAPVHALRPLCEQLVADGNAESTALDGRLFLGVRMPPDHWHRDIKINDVEAACR